jgi:hypothetical protein
LELSCDLKTEREVLISDSLASELRISIEDPKKGLWRLSDDPLGGIRKSLNTGVRVHHNRRKAD